MANEYGDKSHLALYGVTFVNEGQVMSINDIYTENTFQFYAKDVDYLKSERDKNDKGFVREEDLTSRINDLNESGDSPIDSPTLPENETEQGGGAETPVLPAIDPENIYDNNIGDNREEAINKVNEVYENFKKDLQEKLDSGKTTKKEYKELEKKGKKAWKKRKKEIDKYFKKKEDTP
jgi:virion structural protein